MRTDVRHCPASVGRDPRHRAGLGAGLGRPGDPVRRRDGGAAAHALGALPGLPRGPRRPRLATEVRQRHPSRLRGAGGPRRSLRGHRRSGAGHAAARRQGEGGGGLGRRRRQRAAGGRGPGGPPDQGHRGSRPRSPAADPDDGCYDDRRPGTARCRNDPGRRRRAAILPDGPRHHRWTGIFYRRLLIPRAGPVYLFRHGRHPLVQGSGDRAARADHPGTDRARRYRRLHSCSHGVATTRHEHIPAGSTARSRSPNQPDSPPNTATPVSKSPRSRSLPTFRRSPLPTPAHSASR